MTIAHASLTGDQIHEPKGVDTASLGQVYVSDGNGSGAWTNIAATSFTGMVSYFTTPVAPPGWLEADGSDINTTTYDALYNVMAIQQTGTRTNSSAVITGLSSTTNMRAGYFVFGTGITSGTTILTVDSGTQITLSGTAGSSGTSTVAVSPWLLNTGTIRLPNLTGLGKYLRSRASSLAMGVSQSDQNQTHTHTFSGATSTENTAHGHTYGGTVNSNGPASHTHAYTNAANRNFAVKAGSDQGGMWFSEAGDSTGAESASGAHTHSYTGTTNTQDTNHSHTYSGTTASSGSTEARPTTLILMACVKT